MTQRGVIASAQLMREARAPRSKASTGVCSRAHGTRAIVIPLPPVRVPCVCSRAHGKQAAPIIYKLSRNKAFFRPVFGTATPSRDTSETSPRGEEGFYRHFGTATLPTGVSVASSRGKGKGIGTVDGIMVGFTTVFGSAPPATGGSEAGPRAEGDIYRHFGTATLN